MEQERLYALMMEALDGVLDEQESAEFDHLLTQHPDLAQEWEAMQMVDELFRFAPPAPAPVHFAQMTIARLPNPRSRRIFLAMFYALLLIGGLTPIVFGVLLSTQFGGLVEGIATTVNIFGTIFSSLINATGDLFSSQPYLISWVVALFGVIFLWLTAYRRAVSDVQLVPARTN